MTVWTTWPVWRRLSGVAADQVSSSTTLAIQTAMSLHSLADAARSAGLDDPVEPVRAAVDIVSDAHPTAAAIANLRNLVYEAPDIAALVGKLAGEADRLRSIPRLLAKQGATLIKPDQSVLVHSLSASVRAVLDHARTMSEFSVACTVDDAAGEGRQMAAELMESGFSVEALSVEDAASFVGGVDLVLCGADAIGPGRMINKEGTARIAQAGLDGRVPRYVVAGTDKILAEELFFEAAIRAGAIAMELVPLSWFSGVISEIGLLEPGDVSRLATERSVAAQLR